MDGTASREVSNLEEILQKLLGLAHFYQRQLSRVRNPKLRKVLEDLSLQKRNDARALEQTVLDLGGAVRDIPVPLEHPVGRDRDLLPRLYEEEELTLLLCRERLGEVSSPPARRLLEEVLGHEEGHLRAVRDLYRGITHC